MNTETRPDGPPPRVIVIPGPTGVGKTELLDSLFSGRGEVISADSMQVYRYMNIGTAKPSERILQRLPHHLLDILDPPEQFHAGEFVIRAEALIREITARGRVPVISGGTGFYFHNFLFGLPPSPPADPSVRARLKRRLEEQGPESLAAELAQADPLSAARISPGDTYRVLRALEVWHTSGRPLSDFPRPKGLRRDMTFLLVGLRREREELNRRIGLRAEQMFRQGLWDEFRELLDRGYGPEDPGMKGIGYREFFEMRDNGCLGLGMVKERIGQNSRRYAKRQMTFFRGMFPEEPPGEPSGRTENSCGLVWLHPEKDRTRLEDMVEEFLA